MSRPSQNSPSPADRSQTADYAVWRRSVEQALGDDSFEGALTSRAGGLEIEPLYSPKSVAADFAAEALPGRPPYTRGLHPADAGWRIAQEIAMPWAVEAAEAMRVDQQRGVRALWLRMGGIVSAGDWDLEAATDYSGIRLTGVDDVEKLVAAVEASSEVLIYSGDEALATAAMWIAAARRRGIDPRQLKGSFGCDPLADLIVSGRLRGSLSGALRRLGELARWTRDQAPGMRCAMVDISPYHEAGATTVQELAFAIATGVCYLRRMTEAGLDVDAAARQLDFSFSIGRDFFLEIAKLRAARLLWSKVVDASGGGDDAQKMRIHARTSTLETSRVGPWMNLVRGGAQSFAAALGGAQSIRTAPWDEASGWPDDRGRRLATNVQHILAEEAKLDRVVDAAGGSWYLESITDQLARRGWDLFRQLEAEGGMARCMTDGLVAEQVSDSGKELRAAVTTRSIPMIGTSAFADPYEGPIVDKLPRRLSIPRSSIRDLAEESDSISIQELLELENTTLERELTAMQQIDASLAAVQQSVAEPGEPGELLTASIAAAVAGASGEQLRQALVEPGSSAACEAIERFRLAAPFEELRLSSDQWLSSRGRRPRILLLQLAKAGDGGSERSIADLLAFVRRLFAVAGIEAIEGVEVAGAEGAARAFAEATAEAVAILTSGPPHPELGARVVAELRREGAVGVFFAGRSSDDAAAFASTAADGYIYEGCDVLAPLASLHESLRARAEAP